MKKITLLLLFLVCGFTEVFPQCGPNTPTVIADLTGSPDSLWISPWIFRNDLCCDAKSPDRCLKIVLTLDTGAQGIVFDVEEGAMPGGALYYQVGCGPITPVGTKLCLSTPGPHIITFCKPGNNENTYSIQSLPKPSLPAALTLNDGCTGTLTATGFEPASITWTSVAPGTVGQYNNYLSCTSACTTVTVKAQPGYPPYVDFQVCGIPLGGCATQKVCKTTRVNFNPTLFANIQPLNPTVCFGSAGTTITANGVGGTPPYRFLWNTSATTQSIFVGPGTYTVIVQDSTDCPPVSASITVTQFTSAITANAGADRIICAATPQATLSGSVTGVTTGIWSGGTGTFSPSNTTLNAVYTASAAEIANGFVNLILTTTNNGTCPAASDTVRINIVPFQGTPATITTDVRCYGESNGTATVSVSGTTTPYTYTWSTSATTSTITGLPAGTYTVNIKDGNGCPATATAVVNQPAPLTATTTQTNATCYLGSNGSATVTAYGGTTPYTYSWSNNSTNATATGLGAGTHTVTVTDARGCTTSRSVTITQPAIINATISSKMDVSCFGGSDGSATVNASGGTPGFTYTWSPSGGNSVTASGLKAGSYFITVKDANGCEAFANVTITEPAAALTASITAQTNVSCNGGSDGTATVTPTGGTSSYTYSWSTGAITQTVTGLKAGTYTVKVTDAKGCTFTLPVTITEPLVLTATITSTTNVSCFGGANGSATVSASGGTSPYTYSWSLGAGTSATATGLTATTYNVTVTDSKGCQSSTSVTIAQPSAGLAATTSQTDVSCKGGSNGTATVNVTGGTPGYTYSWDPLGGAGPTASSLPAGSYTVNITDSKGCTLQRAFIIAEPLALTATASVVNVSCNGGKNGSIEITPAGGTAAYTYSWSGNVSSGSIANNLAAGTYSITVTDSKGCQTTISATVTQPDLLTGTTTQTNVSCFNGSDGTAEITVTGGTTPYTYTWSSGGGTASSASNLAAGTYTVTVTDKNGCQLSKSVVITQPALLQGVITSTNVLCNGQSNGSATVNATGGTMPYTYSWSSNAGTSATASNLAAGNYTVNIKDAKGCSVNVNVAITQPAVLTVSTAQTNVSCFGGNNGTATATPAGGTSPYTYSWSSGSTAATATGLTAGTYNVLITDANGCTTTTSVNILQPSVPVAVTLVKTNVSCNGGSNGSVTVTASGGTPSYTYSWSAIGGNSPSASGFAAGNYSVKVTDFQGCSRTEFFTIEQPTPLTTSTSVVNTLCGLANGQANVAVSGGTGSYTYSWSPSGGSNATATGLMAGTYYVTVTDANGCVIKDTATIINNTPSIDVTVTKTDVSCYGGNDGTAIAVPQGGQGPYNFSWWPSGGVNDTATGLTAGTYTVTVTDANTCTASKSVVINQPSAPLSVTSFVINHVSCNGVSDGSASVTVTGGTSSYTYSWSPQGGTNATATGLSAGTYTIYITDSKNCKTSTTVIITQPAILAATTTQTDVSCFNGSDGTAQVTATGGTSPYTYSWSSVSSLSSDSNLAAGTYTVTVNDNKGCKITKSVIINQPALLEGVITSSNVLCNGQSNGSATVAVTGGTTPYTYSWTSGSLSATANNLLAGNYSVTVTDSKGCDTTLTVTITEPPVLTSSISGTDVSCYGGSNGTATVTPAGGTAPYTYNWSQGGSSGTITGLVAGNYTVTITDAKGCVTSNSITISEPLAPLSAITSQTNVSCFGGNNGSATVNVSGGTATYTYSWSSGGGNSATASGLSAGNYSVTITDSKGCKLVQSFTITQPLDLTSSIGNVQSVKCFGGNTGSASVIVSGGTPNYTYSWSPSGGTGSTASGLAANTYTVIIKDAQGCADTLTTVITQPSAALSATTSQTNILCYGDSTGLASVQPAGGTAPYTFSWFPYGGVNDSASGLAAGNYNITITDTNECKLIKSITITQSPAMVLNADSANSKCGEPNGSATVTVSGGTPAYTYSWNSSPPQFSSTATGLAAGDYTVTVTDQLGCQRKATVLVNDIAGPAPTIYSIIHVSCYGGSNGSASVTQTGGTPPYKYYWSNGDTTATADSLTAGEYIITVRDSNGCAGLAITNPEITQPPQTLIQKSNTNVSCNGGADGTAALSVSGGTPPYTFSWSPGGGSDSIATGLKAGTYIVTITDSLSCDTSATIVITEPTLLTSSITFTNVSCFGGSNGTATVAANGGTPGYTYSWSSGGTGTTATGLKAGNYSVTVTDQKGCTSTSTVTITEPVAGLTATTGQTNVSCFNGSNGSAWVTVSGGTTPYTYSWDPTSSGNDTITGLPIGDYSAIITDKNGCTVASSMVTITQPTILTATITSSSNVKCYGDATGSATAAVSGGTPGYTYSWSPSGGAGPGATGLTVGTYILYVTDAKGCATSDTVLITEPAAPLAATTTQKNVLCKSGNSGSADVTASGGTTPYTYLWSPSGGTGSAATNLKADNYTITVTDANGCTISKNVTITEPALLTATVNPLIHVSCNGGNNGAATIVPAGGTSPYTYTWSNNDNDSIAQNLFAGTYTATVTDKNGCQVSLNTTITEPPLLKASSVSSTNVSCKSGSNGTATVTPTGGTGAYTYSWSPTSQTTSTATGLSAGSYTVTVKDSMGCQFQSSVQITEPFLLTASITKTDAACKGTSTGSATVTATGGTLIYTYSWSSGGEGSTETGLAAGIYTVTVTDAKGCDTTIAVTINEPTLLTSSITSKNVSCFGGSNGEATVTATGGTTGYTYSWSPYGGTATKATGLKAGNYTVTVTDSKGCISTSTVTITEPLAGLATTTGQTNVSCFKGSDGSAWVTVSGGTVPYTYSWDPGSSSNDTITGLPKGDYFVTVTDDKGCLTVSEIVSITEPTKLIATITSSSNVKCFGDATGSANAAVSGGTPGYTYSWSPSGGAGSSASGLTEGTYILYVSDLKGCTTSDTVLIGQPAAPLAATTDQTNVLCKSGSDGSATVTASGGTSPYTYLWTPEGGTASTANGLKAGNYTITVTDSNSCTTSQTVTITEPTQLTATINPLINVSCNGGEDGLANVAATGGTSPYSYSWSNGDLDSTAENLSAATYTATITDKNGCSISIETTITQPPLLEASTVSSTDVSCQGGSDGTATITPTGGTGAYTYSWLPSNQTTSTAIGLSAGTHTVTVTDSMGCQLERSIEITQPFLLEASVTTIDVGCKGDSTGSATVTAMGGTSNYTYSWSSGGAGSTETGLPAGSHTVKVTDAKGCDTTLVVVINEPTLLASSITSTNVSCFGGSDGTATVTASGGTPGYTYSWSASGGTDSIAKGLKAGNYDVTVTDLKGCISISTVTITEPLAELSSVTGQVDVSCFGGSDGSAWVTASGGTAPYTYSWDPGSSSNDTITGLAKGNYLAIVTDANGCKVASQVVSIIGPPELEAKTENIVNTFCQQVNGQIDGAATGGTGPYQFFWPHSDETTPSVKGLAAGNYTVIVTDSRGCRDTAYATITNTPGGTADIISSTDASCKGYADGSATVVPAGGIPPYTFSWAPDGGNTETGTGLMAGLYTVTVTDSKGCTATAEVIINEPDELVVSIDSIVGPSCKGGNNGVAIATVTGGTTAYTYSWSASTSQTDTAKGLTIGNYTVYVRDSKGCRDSITTTITEPDELLAAVGSFTNVTCTGKNDGTATGEGTGGTYPYTYSWNTDPVQTTQTATGLAPGEYTVTITDSLGCFKTAIVNIIEPGPVNTTVSGPDRVCEDSLAVLTAGATGGTGGYFFYWSQDLGVGNPKTVEPPSTITYNVTAYDANGCPGTPAAITLAVLSLRPSNVNATGSTPICPGSETTVFATADVNALDSLKYIWSNGVTDSSFTVTPTEPTTYYVTITNSCNVSVKDSIRIEFVDLPEIKISGGDYEACAPATFQFSSDSSVVTTEPIGSWLWNFGDNTSSTEANPEHPYQSAGTYTVTLTVVTASGCRMPADTANFSVVVRPKPTAGFTTNPPIVFVPNGSVQLNNTSSGATTYEWDFGDGSYSTEKDPKHKYTAIGSYTVTLITTSEYDCKDTTELPVIATSTLTFPTGFTPNPNGSGGGSYNPNSMDNDVFFPFTAGADEYHLMIFNRWGELIFETFDINIGWDGYYRGELCKQDVYIWKAYARFNDGRTFNGAGDVTLLR